VDAFRQYALTQTNKLIDMELVPQDGANIINQIFDILQNSSEEGGFNALISQLQEVFSATNSNDSLRNTIVCSAASIGYYSARFWSEVTVSEGQNLGKPWGWWVKVLCADIGGALGGAGLGPWWAVIGGVAGSVGAA
jgi:hypothetical protein